MLLTYDNAPPPPPLDCASVCTALECARAPPPPPIQHTLTCVTPMGATHVYVPAVAYSCCPALAPPADIMRLASIGQAVTKFCPEVMAYHVVPALFV